MITHLSDANLSSEPLPSVEAERTLTLLNKVHEMEPTVLIFNVAKCTTEERSRLYVRRFGYCNSDLFVRMNKDPDFGELPTL